MADYDNRVIRGGAATDAGLYDAGLRAYMLRVYNYMLVGLALTGVTAWIVATVPEVRSVFFAYDPRTGGMGLSILGWVAFLAPLGVVLFLSFAIQRMSLATARLTFLGYAALMGVFDSTRHQDH